MKCTPLLFLCLPAYMSAQRLGARGKSQLESSSSWPESLLQADPTITSEKKEPTNWQTTPDDEASASAAARELADAATTYDCVIIGAGWAGLGAAIKLKNENILVLEARDYVGGRSHTGNFSSDAATMVELGSGWIHGASTQNPVFKVAQSSGVEIIKSPSSGSYWSNAFGSNVPHRVPDSVMDPLVKKFENGFYAFQENLQDDTASDMPLRDVANDYIDKKNVNGDNLLAFEMTLDESIVQEYAGSLEDLSLWYWNADSENLPGGDAILNPLDKGYSGVIDYFSKPVKNKIQLNAVVSKIDYSTSTVKVTYTQNGATKVVNALNVIVTVPLGILKLNTIQFVPALPAKKQTAIDKLGMGLLNKCILKWDDATTLPFPTNRNWIEKIAPLGEQGKWTEYFNLQPLTGKNILIAWSAGREADRVETLSDAQIQAEVMASLQTMFGSGSIPDPTEMIITRWRADPYAGGSYSYQEVGSTQQHRKDLAAAVSNRLYFAGEATHVKFPSTTHGALWSGQAAGSKVWNKLRRRKRALVGQKE